MHLHVTVTVLTCILMITKKNSQSETVKKKQRRERAISAVISIWIIK